LDSIKRNQICNQQNVINFITIVDDFNKPSYYKLNNISVSDIYNDLDSKKKATKRSRDESNSEESNLVESTITSKKNKID
jgi:hypothetical protein